MAGFVIILSQIILTGISGILQSVGISDAVGSSDLLGQFMSINLLSYGSFVTLVYCIFKFYE